MSVCGPSGCRTGDFKCSTCKGSGRINGQRLLKINIGKALCADRLSRNVSQRDEAKQLGLDVVMYSQIEFGTYDGEWPEPLNRYWPTAT